MPMQFAILELFNHRLSFSYHISNLSRSSFMHIRDLRRIRFMLDFKIVSTIASSIVHSKLDYCNSLFHSFIHTEHLYSASSRELLRGAPHSSAAKKSSLKLRKKRR